MVRGTLPGPLRQPVFALLGQVYPKLDWAPRPLRAKSTLQALARDSVEGYFHSVSILYARLRRQHHSARMRRDLPGYHPREGLDRVIKADPIQRPKTGTRACKGRG